MRVPRNGLCHSCARERVAGQGQLPGVGSAAQVCRAAPRRRRRRSLPGVGVFSGFGAFRGKLPGAGTTRMCSLDRDLQNVTENLGLKPQFTPNCMCFTTQKLNLGDYYMGIFSRWCLWYKFFGVLTAN